MAGMHVLLRPPPSFPPNERQPFFSWNCGFFINISLAQQQTAVRRKCVRTKPHHAFTSWLSHLLCTRGSYGRCFPCWLSARLDKIVSLVAFVFCTMATGLRMQANQSHAFGAMVACALNASALKSKSNSPWKRRKIAAAGEPVEALMPHSSEVVATPEAAKHEAITADEVVPVSCKANGECEGGTGTDDAATTPQTPSYPLRPELQPNQQELMHPLKEPAEAGKTAQCTWAATSFNDREDAVDVWWTEDTLNLSPSELRALFATMPGLRPGQITQLKAARRKRNNRIYARRSRERHQTGPTDIRYAQMIDTLTSSNLALRLSLGTSQASETKQVPACEAMPRAEKSATAAGTDLPQQQLLQQQKLADATEIAPTEGGAAAAVGCISLGCSQGQQHPPPRLLCQPIQVQGQHQHAAAVAGAATEITSPLPSGVWWTEEMVSMPLAKLRAMLVTMPTVSSDQIEQLTTVRRKMKNRLYARRSRKRRQSSAESGEDSGRLVYSRMIDRLKSSNLALRSSLVTSRGSVGGHAAHVSAAALGGSTHNVTNQQCFSPLLHVGLHQWLVGVQKRPCFFGGCWLLSRW
jgi:hypothetical protein